MYSIMICEDERIDREALRTLVQENFPRLRLLEDCADGTATLRRVPKEKPDSLILDINLPGCNGIDVVRRVRQDGYTGQIMIQTAYDRFSYAQDALNYGANAFLLKPVKHAQFVRTLQDLISALDSRPAWVPESVLGEMTEHLLPRLFAERPGGRADDELDRYLETRMASAAFIALSLSEEARLGLRQRGRDISERLHEVRGLLEESLADGYRLLQLPDGFRYWVLFQENSVQTAEASLQAGALCQTLRSLLAVLDRTGLFLQCAFVCLPHGLNAGMDLPSALTTGLRSRSVDSLLSDTPAVKTLMRDDKEADTILEEGRSSQDVWNAWLQQSGAADGADSFAAACALLASLAAADGGTGEGLLGYGSFKKYFPADLARPHVDRWAVSVLDEMFERFYSQDRNRADLYVRRACSFIKDHYSRDISVTEVAEYVGVSTSHLSHLFRQKLGLAFVDYVQDVRIQKLMELLREKDYSIRELASMLGYNNHTYFCQIVRKRTGKTVKQLKRELHMKK